MTDWNTPPSSDAHDPAGLPAEETSHELPAVPPPFMPPFLADEDERIPELVLPATEESPAPVAAEADAWAQRVGSPSPGPAAYAAPAGTPAQLRQAAAAAWPEPGAPPAAFDAASTAEPTDWPAPAAVAAPETPTAEVPAAAPTPPATPPKTPLLKRELSFRRRRAPGATAAASAVAAGEKKPLLKRELSFRRRSTVAAPAVAAPTVAQGEKTPLLKRELSFRRSGGAATSAAAPKTRTSGRRSTAAAHAGKRLVGVTVGAAHLSAAEVVNNGHAELVKLARRPLARGVVVGGELREPETLAAELKAFFREHKLPQRGVRLGIANNRIGVRIIDVAGVDEGKQLDNAVRFRAQEALPIPIDQAVLDYHVLGETSEDGVVSRRILLVVAYREPVDRYVAAFRAAGIRLAGIDLEAFGLLRSLGRSRDTAAARAEAADVVVSVGHEHSILAVSGHGVCEFTRVFDWGGFALDVAVARELDLAPSAAEATRRSVGISGSLAPAGLSTEQAAAIREAVQRQIQSFARELVSSLQYYQDQPDSLGLDEIVLTGGLSETPGLDRELERMIGVPVRVGNPLDRVKTSKRLNDQENLPAYAGAIGLGIEV